MAKQALIFTEQDYGLDVPDWAEMLTEANFAAWSHCLMSDERPDEVSLAADILLVDLHDVSEGALPGLVKRAVALREQFGFAKARVPMVAITHADVPFDEPSLQPFADVLMPPLTQDLIANRLTSLMRLATMRREAERRARTFKRFGVGLPVVPPPHDLSQQNLLYLGSGMAFLPIQSALPQSIESFAALTPQMALDYMKEQQFDALIVELRDFNEHLIDFVGKLRRNSDYFSFPRHSHLPQGRDRGWPCGPCLRGQ